MSSALNMVTSDLGPGGQAARNALQRRVRKLLHKLRYAELHDPEIKATVDDLRAAGALVADCTCDNCITRLRNLP